MGRKFPPTFADKHALVCAEIARIEGRELDAERLYEQAIRSARDHDFVQNEGLAYEVAARFYTAAASRLSPTPICATPGTAISAGAPTARCRQLDRLDPHLAVAEGAPRRPLAPIQQLDVASIVKASQALSTEIELPKLIERLMTIALENAGADRGLLILPAGEDYLIQAQGQTTGDQVEVVLRQTPITRLTCPDSLLRYVIRTRESVIIGDASRPNPFSEDEYLRGRQPRSILCLPLIKQGRLTGLLYLENRLTSHAFTPDRIAVLELLAAQAAISLENTRLYSDLREREAKVRRLVNSNIIGIYIWDFQGRIIDANDAFLEMVGYSREDLVSGRLYYPGLTPPEWDDVSERARAVVKTTGTAKVFEKEYLRKDGSRVPILLGGATFGDGQEQGVAFVLDLTERKRAEENLRESERRYREAQAELAHVNRVTTMGQLTASIAHEINQPLAGIASNGAAGLNWLNREQPDLDRARDAFSRIVNDSARASERDSWSAGAGQEVRSAIGQARYRRRHKRSAGAHHCRVAAPRRCAPNRLGRRRSTGAGRPNSVAAGFAELDHEWRRCDESGYGTHEGADGDLHSSRCGQRAGFGRRQRHGTRPRRPATHLRAFFHDEIRRPRHGAFDLPIDRREPSRPVVGVTARTPRSGHPLHRPRRVDAVASRGEAPLKLKAREPGRLVERQIKLQRRSYSMRMKRRRDLRLDRAERRGVEEILARRAGERGAADDALKRSVAERDRLGAPRQPRRAFRNRAGQSDDAVGYFNPPRSTAKQFSKPTKSATNAETGRS